jgi:hypothetical protein
LALLAASALAVTAAPHQVDYDFFSPHPRLLLTERRLKLLKRERERESLRWRHFEMLMAGKARMDEPGFARALYGIVKGDPCSCQEAADWALKEGSLANAGHLRQMALVYDWCGREIGESAAPLRKKMAPALAGRALDAEMVRSRVFAALALAESFPAESKAALKHAVEQWWKARIVPQLTTGKIPFQTRSGLYALVEFLHAIRDNFREDLRDGAPAWFEQLPPLLLLSYYPRPWPEAEYEYRIPMYVGAGDPDLRESALSRASEMALVAYDTNAQPYQFLQGWVMQDRFMMRGAFGAVYEYFWANPYHPGLSFTYMPDLFYENGRLLVRAGWDEDAVWFCSLDGVVQVFRDGRRIPVRIDARPEPVELGPVKIFFASAGLQIESGWLRRLEEEMRPVDEVAFVVGLEPGAAFLVETEGRKSTQERADSGGILMLKFPPGHKAKVRLLKPAARGRDENSQ